jgi:glycosyltransferase involved in cell wall biosynthesis
MAYHYGKPVIASRVGGLEDSVAEGRTGYLVEPGSPSALAAVLEELSRDDLEAMRVHIDAVKAGMTWEGLADALLGLFEPAREPVGGVVPQKSA